MNTPDDGAAEADAMLRVPAYEADAMGHRRGRMKRSPLGEDRRGETGSVLALVETGGVDATARPLGSDAPDLTDGMADEVRLSGDGAFKYRKTILHLAPTAKTDFHDNSIAKQTNDLKRSLIQVRG